MREYEVQKLNLKNSKKVKIKIIIKQTHDKPNQNQNQNQPFSFFLSFKTSVFPGLLEGGGGSGDREAFLLLLPSG